MWGRTTKVLAVQIVPRSRTRNWVISLLPVAKFLQNLEYRFVRPMYDIALAKLVYISVGRLVSVNEYASLLLLVAPVKNAPLVRQAFPVGDDNYLLTSAAVIR